LAHRFGDAYERRYGYVPRNRALEVVS